LEDPPIAVECPKRVFDDGIEESDCVPLVPAVGPMVVVAWTVDQYPVMTLLDTKTENDLVLYQNMI
jgi:hypothetical protein